MTIDLSDYEAGAKYGGDYEADLLALQDRLGRIQAAHIMHGHQSIILLEGWDASGKGGIGCCADQQLVVGGGAGAAGEREDFGGAHGGCHTPAGSRRRRKPQT